MAFACFGMVVEQYTLVPPRIQTVFISPMLYCIYFGFLTCNNLLTRVREDNLYSCLIKQTLSQSLVNLTVTIQYVLSKSL